MVENIEHYDIDSEKYIHIMLSKYSLFKKNIYIQIREFIDIHKTIYFFSRGNDQRFVYFCTPHHIKKKNI